MAGDSATYVDLHFTVREEDGQWVSECVELGVATCGDTLQEALSAILDATSLYIESLRDEGELDRVFGERGLQALPDAEPEIAAELTAHLPVSARAG